MNIVSSLKSIPVTKAHQFIITAWDKETETVDERKPFRVYLPCGAEGIAVGDEDALSNLMDAQCEGHWVEQMEFTVESDITAYWEGTTFIGCGPVGIRIEVVHHYIAHRIARQERRKSARAFEATL